MSIEQDNRLNITPSLSVELSADLTELHFLLHPAPSALTPPRARALARWLLDAADLLEAETNRRGGSGRRRPDDGGAGGGSSGFEVVEQPYL